MKDVKTKYAQKQNEMATGTKKTTDIWMVTSYKKNESSPQGVTATNPPRNTKPISYDNEISPEI